jgi:hypothetical protein
VAWRSGQSDPLVKLVDLNMEPAFRLTFHIGADPAARDLLAVAVNPSDRLGLVMVPGSINPRRASKLISSFKPSWRHIRCLDLGICVNERGAALD